MAPSGPLSLSISVDVTEYQGNPTRKRGNGLRSCASLAYATGYYGHLPAKNATSKLALRVCVGHVKLDRERYSRKSFPSLVLAGPKKRPEHHREDDAPALQNSMHLVWKAKRQEVASPLGTANQPSCAAASRAKQKRKDCLEKGRGTRSCPCRGNLSLRTSVHVKLGE